MQEVFYKKHCIEAKKMKLTIEEYKEKLLIMKAYEQAAELIYVLDSLFVIAGYHAKDGGVPDNYFINQLKFNSYIEHLKKEVEDTPFQQKALYENLCCFFDFKLNENEVELYLPTLLLKDSSNKIAWDDNFSNLIVLPLHDESVNLNYKEELFKAMKKITKKQRYDSLVKEYDFFLDNFKDYHWLENILEHEEIYKRYQDVVAVFNYNESITELLKNSKPITLHNIINKLGDLYGLGELNGK